MPLPELATGLDIAQRHAVQTLAADIDDYRHGIDATVEAVQWDSVGARMLRRLAREVVEDMRITAYQLRALL